ncbi:ATP-dependent RNA helicase DDX24 [Engraulis encrasicolus]|uniref:ATP-dependent RNA helicase DDX24 n=1 Tax=Engraulis encrasicolus TaxID=184585 RepID=UPI002FD553A1
MKPKKSMSKAGGRVVGGGPKRGLLIKGKWKAVELDPSLFANEEMGGLVCFEELTEYSLVETERAFLPAEKSPTKKNTEKKKKKKKQKKDTEEVVEEEKNEVEEEGKKKQSKKGKKRKASAMTEAKDEEEKAEKEEKEEGEEGMMMMEEEEELAEPPAKKKKKKRQKKKKKNAAAANQGQAESETGDATGDADTPEQKSTPEEAGTGTEQDPPGTNCDPPGKKKSQAQEKQTGEDKPSVTPKKKNKNKNKKKNKTTAEGAEQTSATVDEQTEASSQNPAAEQKKQTQKNKKKEKKKAKEASTAASATGTTQPEKKKKKKQKKKEVKNWTSAALAARGGTAGADVSAWKDLFVPSPVLQALSCLGFAHPTPIQALALPPAIRDHLDVLGAAETGSGKTLSFGIPILHNILEWKQASETWIANKKAEQEAAANQTAEQAAATNEVAEQEGATNELDTEAKEAANGSAQEDETPPPASNDVTSSSAAAAEGNSGKAEEETPAVEEGGEEEEAEGEEKQEVEEEEDQSEEEGEEEEELELQSEDDDDDDEAVDLASEEGGEDDSDDDDADDDDEAAVDEDRGCIQIRSVEEGDSHTNEEEKEEEGEGPKQPLLALVLTPTRELAVQVKHHIDAIAQFTGIRTAIVVGGMAPQKQTRVLSRRPEIVIATPGRLWDLIKDGHPHLTDLRHLRSLVIDEADRMVERGHFAELENLLEMLNTSQFNPKRQTFVFSATLTMVHSLPLRVMQKKSKRGQQNPNSSNKLELLMQKVGIRDKPKVIDLTRQQATVETLVETRIQCTKEEKDFYLYYFLSQYPGRTMVFANSIECIKRLSSLLLILDQTPLPLHANMHQKQRLKNLERFAEREHCVLLTTDVAARGLDIPNVQHVIHYQVPRTSETYVHRSGRTARATKQGLSLLLIGPDDLMNYKKIYRTLGKDEDLPTFPVQTRCMAAIKERVKLAWRIEKIEYHNSKQRHHNSWFTQQAEAMDIDLDDDVLMAAGRDQEADLEQQRLVKGLKKQLKHLLGQPVFRNEMKTRYPTQMGKLQLPQLPLATAETALTSLANQKTVRKQWTRKKPNKK